MYFAILVRLRMVGFGYVGIRGTLMFSLSAIPIKLYTVEFALALKDGAVWYP